MSSLRTILGPDPTNRVLALALRGIYATSDLLGKLILFTFHMRLFTPGTGMSKVNIINAIDSAWAPTLTACLAGSDSVPLTWDLRYLDDALDGVESFPCSLEANGTAGDRLPLFTAAVVRKTTDVRGRSYRGSLHLAPIAEGDSTMDACAAGLTTKLTALCGALQPQVIDADANVWQPIVVSTKQSQTAVNATSIVCADIQTFTPNLKLGTMKHRKEK
jgi:hypothetical protein